MIFLLSQSPLNIVAGVALAIIAIGLILLMLRSGRGNAAGSDFGKAYAPIASAPGRPTSGLVLVIGDETAPVVAENLQGNGIRATTDMYAQNESGLVIFAVDSTRGPMPEHHEVLKKLSSEPAEKLLILFTKTNLVDDPELFELEEMECRELFDHFGQPGDHVPIAFDSKSKACSNNYPKGWDALFQYVRSVIS